MNDSMSNSWLDAATKRWPFVLTTLPYLLLGFCTGLTVLIKGPGSGSLRIDLALSGLAAAWMLFMFTLHPPWRDRQAAMMVFLAGLIVIIAVLARPPLACRSLGNP